MFSPLRTFIQNLSTDSKKDTIHRIGKTYSSGRGSFQSNVKTICDYLSVNEFRPPYTENHLNEFIGYLTQPQFEEYFEERVTEQDDDENELQQLQQLRDEINERISELQQHSQARNSQANEQPQNPVPEVISE